MEHREKKIEEIIKELTDCQDQIHKAEQCSSGREEAVHEARAVFEDLFESAPDALVVVDHEGRIMRLNAQAERLFGYAREELIGQDHGILVPERFRKRHEAELTAYMDKPRTRIMGIGLELWGLKKDGSEFPADIDLGPLETEDQFSVVSVVRDVTPRKRLEDNLQHSEQRYRELVELSPDAVFVIVEGKFAFANAAGAALFGAASPEQMIGKPIMERVHPEYREIVRGRSKQVTEQGMIAPLIEEKLLRLDGSTVYVEVIARPYTYYGKPASLAIVRDITTRKQAELARKISEERYQRTVDNMLEGCQIIGFDWRFLYLNDAAITHARQAKEKLLGHTMMEMYPGIEQTEVFASLRECMEKRVAKRMENEFTFPDGSKGWFEVSIEPVPEGLFILSLDITDRKKLEEELNGYRQRLEEIVAKRTAEFADINRKLEDAIAAHEKIGTELSLRATILDHAGEAIFVLNHKGDFVYANEAAGKAYGYGRDEFINMNLRHLLRPQDAPSVEPRLKEIFTKGQLEVETIHVRKDGSLMPVLARHSAIKTLHGEFIVSIMRDLKSQDTESLGL